jgi:hypothetical protein
MCIRFVFLLMTRFASWLRLSRREEAWKTAEILILRHQIAVLQQEPRRPKLNWADRALLAALLGVTPEARRYRLRLLVTRERFALAPLHHPPPPGDQVPPATSPGPTAFCCGKSALTTSRGLLCDSPAAALG